MDKIVLGSQEHKFIENNALLIAANRESLQARQKQDCTKHMKWLEV